MPFDVSFFFFLPNLLKIIPFPPMGGDFHKNIHRWVISVWMFGCPIITHEHLGRFASNFYRRSRENYRNVLNCIGKTPGKAWFPSQWKILHPFLFISQWKKNIFFFNYKCAKIFWLNYFHINLKEMAGFIRTKTLIRY